jgi:trk system potassium uptake protein TrkA
MKIVILGAGKTGRYAAAALSQEQHDVILIDRDAKVLEQISREIDVATLLSTMPNLSVFTSLLEMKPDLFFAATGSDETNLVCCSLAKNLGISKTVAKVSSSAYLESDRINMGRLFYVDHFIGAEMLCAQDLFKLLTHTADTAFQHFAHGTIIMRTIKIPDHWKKGDVQIKELKLPQGLIAGLIRRDEEILFPHGDDLIKPGDHATLIGKANVINYLHDLFDITEKRVKSAVLIGGSAVAVHLTHLLQEQHISVKIIEKCPVRSRELADELPKATIINRDGKDFSALIEEGVQSADALVSCTEDEGTDLLISSMAMQIGCPKAIALVGNPACIPLFEKAQVTPALSSRVNVVNRLLSILHHSTISVGSISNDAAKIVELKVSPSSKLIGMPLSSMKLPSDLLIATIENHGKVMIGQGSSILCPDDTVVAICSPSRLEQLQQLFL